MARPIHIVDPLTEEWYHLDENYNVWTCWCITSDKPNGDEVSLCLSICDHLKAGGELREIEHKIAMKRKELGLLAKDNA